MPGICLPGTHVSRARVYLPNIGILKQYGENRFRAVWLRSLRQAGYEEENGAGKKNSANNTEKLSQSISRTRTTVFELAICNPWGFFATFTLSAANCDRYLLDEFQRKLRKWLNNCNSRNGTAIKYLLIPEEHKDGAWHMHGLLLGIPESHLRPFTLQDKIPKRMKDMIRGGRELYDWPAAVIK